MSQKKKWSALVVALVLAALLVTSCSSPQKTETKVLAPERKIKTIEIWTMTPEYSQDRYEAALMIASWWKQLGLDVQAKPMDGTVISSKTRTPPWDFDTYMLQWFGTPERIDPQLFIYQVFHSSQDVEGGANRSGYRNPEYDQLAEAQMRETNPEKRQEYVLKAQELLAEDVPVITLYFKNLRQVYNHDRFSGIVEMPGVGINNIWTFLRAEPKTTDRVLRVASPDDCDNLNPMIAWINADWDILYLIYDTLVRLGPDGQPTPSAASSWEFKSPTVLQVKLKEGLKFHDGKPLTAEDVKFTFEYALKWGMPKVAGFVKPVKAVRVLDQHTLEFETAQPVGSLVSGTLAAVPILPKHIWEGLLEREKIAKPADWANPHPIGSGPLKFRYWRRGEEIRLDTFKEYHTPAKIDGVLQIIYPSPDALLGAMELGKADLTMQDLAPLHAQKASGIKHLTVTDTPWIGWTYIGLNMRRPPFNDPVFRQALAHATDCRTLVEVLLDGHGVAGGAGRVIAPANKFWYNPNVKQYEFSIDKARKLLKDAGYEWDEEGRLYYPAPSK